MQTLRAYIICDLFIHVFSVVFHTNIQYIPPYDHPLLWEGHASIIDEIAAQIPYSRSRNSPITTKTALEIPDSSETASEIPDSSEIEAGIQLLQPGAIIASCGGGGLLCGIYKGLKKHDWNQVNFQ
jgi:L-serine/L-threonine ammonia-lyase